MNILGQPMLARLRTSVPALAYLALALAVFADPALHLRPQPYPEVVRVGVETAGRPFTFQNESGEPDGFCVELLREIARDQGLRLEITAKPWPEILPDFRAGRIDVLGNVAYSSDRAEFMDFSATNLRLRGALYTLRGSKPINSPAELHGLRIAVLRDSLGHLYVQNQPWNARITPCISREDAVAALRARQVDAIVMMELVMNYYLRVEKVTDIVQADIEFDDFEYRLHFAVAAGNKQLLRAINEGLLGAHRSGAFDRLHEKWLGPLQPRKLRWKDLQPYVLPVALIGLALAVVIARQRFLLTRIRRQARELLAGEQRLHMVMEAGCHGLWNHDFVTGNVVRSDLASTMLGYQVGEIAPGYEAWLELIHPDDRAHVAEMREHMQRPGPGHFAAEYRMRNKQGDWQWIATTGKVAERDGAGRALRAIGTHTDVTARVKAEEANKELQEKMLEAQKLESLGVLAGGIAHDFNNLLTAIMGNVSLAREEAGRPREVSARLDQVLLASKRAADLCRQLLAYAGMGEFELTRFNLNDIVRDTSEMLSVALAQRARLDFALGESLPPVEGDISQIRQVVMNLVLNAAEAMPPDGGRIRIATSASLLNPGQLAAALPEPLAKGGVYLHLEIADTGCGMTPEVRAKIFEPFFTTKFSGRGLGLAAVLGIVRAHKGALTVESEPGRGTTFRIYLPMAVSAKPMAAAV